MKKYVTVVTFLAVMIPGSLLFAAQSQSAVVGQVYAQNALQQQLQNIATSISEESKPAPASEGPVRIAQQTQQTAPPRRVQQQTTQPPTTQAVTTTSAPSATRARTTATAPGAAASNANNETDQLDVRDEAFARMTTNLLPLSPAQIEMLRGLYDATQKAAAVFPGTPPKPTSTSIIVDLSPGKTPPVIRLGAGFVTSIVFIDSTGAPWPVDSYSLGNPSAFNIQWDKKSNILLMQAITSHRVANLAVILKGLNTPVMINLTPGQAAMDTRVDLRIPGFGPSARKPAFGLGLPGTESQFLVNLLDGIPPNGARALKTVGCENCAWSFEGKLYLRMQYTLLSPGWISTLSSADGTNVYELQPTPLVLASYNGKTIKLSIEGF